MDKWEAYMEGKELLAFVIGFVGLFLVSYLIALAGRFSDGTCLHKRK